MRALVLMAAGMFLFSLADAQAKFVATASPPGRRPIQTRAAL